MNAFVLDGRVAVQTPRPIAMEAATAAAAASGAVQRLLESADIEDAGGRKYRVVDPLYAEWIAALDAG